jgi:hypothetical protein
MIDVSNREEHIYYGKIAEKTAKSCLYAKCTLFLLLFILWL